MDTIFEIRATLVGSTPCIYRVFWIPSSFTLTLLHETFQALFTWENFHRHFFKNEDNTIINKELERTLKDIFENNSKITYVYDLGNAWTLDVELVKQWDEENEKKYPICVGGSRKSPPEDSGGIVGYQMAIELLETNESRDVFLLYDWYGEDYNPEEFSIAEINSRLDYLRGNS
ncbi:MAG TPA: plasmid pRiA4b ORF-3 family protein [Tenuifilaceae bacterium]|nr:plasmid pRiA4b ORF-3 family protein [Tenuifilaceae bacterium]HPE18979.1 plasmid pRiA4b ORF-3 family protein [Tenuifilaceae bacterium]HPJ44636.1 plasmid pRiA4b ORF-3 family protein [Tenuifilaceae bacterium]HPQ33962.1 plasmid pRiA4b ORF-3 family protein [Tenuifilaceae bacterium]HRX69011.1 plasmid pRiA4b ORF-3 family protein [Tenuifilaceae bacterium]